MNNLNMLRKKKITNLLSFLWFTVVLSLYPSIEFDRKNRVVFGNNNRVKYCTKQRFEEKIAVYIDELQNDFSQSCSTVFALNKMLLKVQNCTKLEQVIALLNRMDGLFIKENKRAQCALLLRVSVVLGDYTSEMLLDLLAIVESHLFYWQKMNDHSNYYFFHKSPFKWIAGKNQQQEVNDNIELLHAIQKKYLKTLGLLTKHLQQFNGGATIDEHYTWLGQFIMIIQTLCTQRHKVEVIDCENVMSAMRRVLKNILPYKKHVMLIIDKAKPSDYLVRNWMRYLLLFIGTGFAYKNRVLIDAWVGKKMENQYKEFLHRAWREYFVNPMKGAYETIMINKEQKKFNMAGEIQEQEQLIAQNKKLLKEKNNDLEKYIKNTEKIRTVTLELVKKDLQQKRKFGKITTKKEMEIGDALQKSDIRPFLQYISNLPKTKIYFGGIEVTAVQSMWDLLQFVVFSDGQKVMNDTRSILNHGSKTLINIDEVLIVSKKTLSYCVGLLDSEFKKNQMTLRFTALIPAMVTGWGMYKLISKLYAWLTRCNYSVMRNIVAQINTMFVEFQGDMNNESYGELIYLLYKLKCVALVQIPQKNIKREFLRDIEMFLWYDYTAGEKRLLINNMRWKYDFLSPVYNT